MKSFSVIDRYGNIYWFKPGTDILHREDGHAVDYANGRKRWYLSDINVTEEEHAWFVSRGIYNPRKIPKKYRTEYILRFK